MNASRAQAWIPAALVLAAVYFLVGRYFPQPAANLRAWRLGAWAVCGIAYAAHLAYELFRRRSAPSVAAFHVAAAVAIAAFALAAAGMAHALSTAAGLRPIWFFALVLWPAVTAVPAFLLALIAGNLESRLR